MDDKWSTFSFMRKNLRALELRQVGLIRTSTCGVGTEKTDAIIRSLVPLIEPPDEEGIKVRFWRDLPVEPEVSDLATESDQE